MNFARKRDSNEREIVLALKAAGASVTQLNGTGIPDLLVGFMRSTVLLEVKLPDGPKGGRRAGGASARSAGGDGVLTAAQITWWREWRGTRPTVVRSVAEALSVLAIIRTAIAAGAIVNLPPVTPSPEPDPIP